MWKVISSIIGCATLAAACDGRSPVTPAALRSADVTLSEIRAVAIVGPGVVEIGSSAVFVARATMPDGRTVVAVEAGWKSDNTDVATIDGSGLLTAHASGSATITATYRERAAIALVRVPNAGNSPLNGTASLSISFRPDPLVASRTPCTGPFRTTPSWSSDEIIAETGGVGFRVLRETLNLYSDTSLYQNWFFPEQYYFAPHSSFVEDGCTTLGGAPSGYLEEILEGVDDNGHQLTFAVRVRLPPLTAASSAPTLLSPPPPSGAPVGARRRNR